jgi:hypothetical protein
MNLFFRLFGCQHSSAMREHREDGWYWSCWDCGRSGLINPRARQTPKAVGAYDHRKALAGKARAEKAATQRQQVAVRISEAIWAQKSRPSAHVLPIRQAR